MIVCYRDGVTDQPCPDSGSAGIVDGWQNRSGTHRRRLRTAQGFESGFAQGTLRSSAPIGAVSGFDSRRVPTITAGSAA